MTPSNANRSPSGVRLTKGEHRVNQTSTREPEITMFSHVMVGADDVAASKQFCDAHLVRSTRTPKIWMTKAAVFISRHRASLPSRHPSMGSLLAEQTCGTIGFAAASPAKRMPGTRRALKMVVQRSKTCPVSTNRLRFTNQGVALHRLG